MRTAISPRFAIKILSNNGLTLTSVQGRSCVQGRASHAMIARGVVVPYDLA